MKRHTYRCTHCQATMVTYTSDWHGMLHDLCRYEGGRWYEMVSTTEGLVAASEVPLPELRRD